MQDNKDRLQAHLYLASRLRSALIAGDPNLLRPPMTRSWRGGWWGVALSALLFAGFALYGAIRPGGRAGWAVETAIVVEKESGARFLYVGDALHPVLNYSSALLAGGDPDNVQRVSRASLADARRGATIGIPGAPDALPTEAEIDSAEWAVCATATDGTDDPPEVSVVFGAELGGAPLGEGEAVLATTPGDGAAYLVTGRAYHRIDDTLVLTALGLDGAPAHPLRNAWLNALTEATPIGLPNLGFSGDGMVLDDGTVVDHGQVLRAELIDGSPRLYVVVDGSLAPVSELTAALLVAVPVGRGTSAGVLDVDLGAVAGVPRSDRVVGAPDWPGSVPDLQSVSTSRPLCVRFALSDAETAEGDATLLPLPGDGVALEVPDDAVTDRTADSIITVPNSGALLRGVSGGVAGDAWFLVTENGVKYPIATVEDLQTLGYDGVAVDRAPNELLDFLPTGPGLSGDDARVTAAVDSR